jgi:hypothetical protein
VLREDVEKEKSIGSGMPSLCLRHGGLLEAAYGSGVLSFIKCKAHFWSGADIPGAGKLGVEEGLSECAYCVSAGIGNFAICIRACGVSPDQGSKRQVSRISPFSVH